MTQPIAAVPDPDDPIPVIESEPDEETKPFRVAYRRGGERVEEQFDARVHPPFAIFQRLHDLEVASAAAIPGPINSTARRLFLIALTDESSTRLLRLIEGDEDEVGVITSKAIGGVVDFIRELHYASPTRRGSSSGRKRAARTSSGAPSARKSTSARSRQKKA